MDFRVARLEAIDDLLGSVRLPGLTLACALDLGDDQAIARLSDAGERRRTEDEDVPPLASLRWDTFARPPARAVRSYQWPNPTDAPAETGAIPPASGEPSTLEAASACCARLYLGLGLEHPGHPPRIAGLSSQAAHAVYQHARSVGTDLATLESRTNGPSLLNTGLDQLVGLLRFEIFHTLSSFEIQNALTRPKIILDPVKDLLTVLTTFLSTGEPDLDSLFNLADHLLRAGNLPIIQVIVTWILDRSTIRLLKGWETWLGLVRDDDIEQCHWIKKPQKDRRWRDEYDEIYSALWNDCGIECVQAKNAKGLVSEEDQDLHFSVCLFCFVVIKGKTNTDLSFFFL